MTGIVAPSFRNFFVDRPDSGGLAGAGSSPSLPFYIHGGCRIKMHDYLLDVFTKPKVCPNRNLRLIELLNAMSERGKPSPDKDQSSK
jgi:hypothetical protein